MDDDMDELPELVVTELSQDELTELRGEPAADATLSAEVAELIEEDNDIVEDLLAWHDVGAFLA